MRGQKLLLAYSGGVDSTALLLILHYLGPRLAISLEAAHLDHGLRPESGSEAAMAAQFCRELGLKCHLGLEDVGGLAQDSGLGLEDAARQARYAFLQRVRAQCGAKFIATAHQLNDLAEDQIMRLTRGTGWPGLAGMHGFDPGRGLLRPLLLTPREELAGFLKALEVPWSEDPSNADLTRKRNRVRHEILPLFAAENPDYLSAAARLWRQARADEEAFEAEIEPLKRACRGSGSAITVERAALLGLSQSARLRFYKWALGELGPGQVLSERLFELDSLFMRKQNGKTLQFPGGKSARLTGLGLTFAV